MTTVDTSPALDTPWTAEPGEDGFYCVVNNHSVVIAKKCVKEEAQLFATAPKLLEALKDARDYVALMLDKGGDDGETAMLRSMNRVIKKATRGWMR